jgi:hypothetical protein
MNPDLFWIPGPWQGKLAKATRPRGGVWLADEVSGWRRAGLDVVVSLLETSRSRFQTAECRPQRAMRSHCFSNIAATLDAGQNVAVHCRQGIGRSGLIAADLLVLSGMAL